MTYAEIYARPFRPYSCADPMRAVRATLNRPMRRPMRAMRGQTYAQVGGLNKTPLRSPERQTRSTRGNEDMTAR